MTKQIKKLKSHLGKKKGYLEIDFAISILLFFILFTSVFLLYQSYRDLENKKLILTQMDSEARNFCVLLVSSPGVPQNFENDINSMIQPGFREATSNNISQAKFQVFNSTNYFTILDSIGADYFIYLELRGLSTQTKYLTFGTKHGVNSLFSNYVCYSNYNGEIVRLFVEAWK